MLNSLILYELAVAFTQRRLLRSGGRPLTFKVRGKGNLEHLAHLGDASQAALEAWLSVRGWTAGPLLVPISREGD